jgi:hypothetical protein
MILTGYDVFKLAGHFGCDPSDIVEKHCIYPKSEKILPLLRVCPHSCAEVRTVLETVGSGEDMTAVEAWDASIGQIDTVLQKLHQTLSPEVYHSEFRTAFAIIYTLYDTDRDFAGQCRRNASFLLDMWDEAAA